VCWSLCGEGDDVEVGDRILGGEGRPRTWFAGCSHVAQDLVQGVLRRKAELTDVPHRAPERHGHAGEDERELLGRRVHRLLTCPCQRSGVGAVPVRRAPGIITERGRIRDDEGEGSHDGRRYPDPRSSRALG